MQNPQRSLGRTTAPPRGTVPAVIRAARLLDVLSKTRDPISLAELTRALRLPKSTVHALCTTLVHTGFVTRMENGTYHLGPHVMDLAHGFLSRIDLTTEFNRIWESLAVLPEETIVLSVRDGMDVVYIACRNGTRPLGISFRIGMRLPASCTASGKALLSGVPPQRLEQLLANAAFPALTRKSVTNKDALLKQLAQARKQGYAVDDEETRDGMMCFGAPVFDGRSSEPVAGVAVSLLKAATTRDQKELAIAAVKQVAQALSQALGARPTGAPAIGTTDVVRRTAARALAAG